MNLVSIVISPFVTAGRREYVAKRVTECAVYLHGIVVNSAGRCSSDEVALIEPGLIAKMLGDVQRFLVRLTLAHHQRRLMIHQRHLVQ